MIISTKCQGLLKNVNFVGNFRISSYKTTFKQQLNSEKWDTELGYLSAFG